jgi:hypothetical protein
MTKLIKNLARRYGMALNIVATFEYTLHSQTASL